jgi:hypothetical protein
MWLPPGTSLIAEDRRGPAGLCWRALPHLTDVSENGFHGPDASAYAT